MPNQLTTVLGPLAQVAQFANDPRYNVLFQRDDWSIAMNRAWLLEAVKRGDMFLITSTNLCGMYAHEVMWLLEFLRDASNCAQGLDHAY